MGNIVGMVRGTIKYGYAFGPRVLVGPCAIGASERFYDTGGHFVKFDGNRYIEVAGDTHTALFGWAECGKLTAGADGVDEVMVDICCEAVYYIPSNATVDITMRGKKCDLVVDTYRQRANVGEATEGVITIVDVDIANTAVYVRMNYETQYQASIA